MAPPSPLCHPQSYELISWREVTNTLPNCRSANVNRSPKECHPWISLPHLDGQYPVEVDLAYVPPTPTHKAYPIVESDNVFVNELSKSLDRMFHSASAITRAQQYHNKRRRDLQCKAGQQVCFDVTHLLFHPDSHNAVLAPRLRAKYAAPLQILAVLSLINYELEMPHS